MSVLVWAVWGFGATVVLTTILAGCQGLGWTRLSLPWLLGAFFTPDRDRARAVGIAVHLVNGWLLSLVYFGAFAATGRPSVALGTAIGLVHGLFVAAVGLQALPAVHPRIARPHAGPTTERRIEPPGFLARNYGWSTAAVVLAAHAVFGAVLGLGAALGR
ncbi:MAG TPA: hypothetical protein VLA98_06050 [Solirubrobacteraceae bacterium]|jgi:hypothetical protein|nr:hypothetical protein [Solirubrobacteraceae bacterium]